MCCQIKLIGLLAHLGYTGEVEFIAFFNINLNLQTGQIVFHIDKLLLLLFALCICLVLFRFLLVLIRQSVDTKIIICHLLNKRNQVIGLLREFGNSHLWQHLLNKLPFCGIIVNEHHRICSYIKFFTELSDISCLILPIDTHSGEIFFLQHHIRIIHPYLLHILRIVFAANCQDYTIIF